MTTCPAPIPGFTPRAVQSPSAIREYATCPRQWGHNCLEGRREPQLDFFDLPAKPAKPEKGASAVEQARYKSALKVYNRAMRPAQGTTLHKVWELYYRHKVPGAWHPPMQWRAAELDELWQTRPGQIALSGREHMPAPGDLAEVWIEDLVSIDLGALLDPDPVAGLYPAQDHILIGGTPDLVTMRHVEALYPDEPWSRLFHLYDYKSTVSIADYAKTAAELLDDEQVNIYGLAVMQRHGLDSIDCTWLYFQTDPEKPPRSMPVRFTLTRAHAEANVRKIVALAAAMQEAQDRYLAEKPGMLGGRLKVIQALDTNDMACNNFGGCAYHHTKPGGICKPRKSTLGEAMRRQAAERQKTEGRREAAKADKAARAAIKVGKGKTHMAMTEEQAARFAELEAKGTNRNFKENQELLKLKKLGPAPSEQAEDVETTGESAPSEPPPVAEKPAPSAPAAKPAKKAEAPAPAGDEAGIYMGATRVPLDKSSPLHKSILKICKAYEALEAAKAGE